MQKCSEIQTQKTLYFATATNTTRTNAFRVEVSLLDHKLYLAVYIEKKACGTPCV